MDGWMDKKAIDMKINKAMRYRMKLVSSMVVSSGSSLMQNVWKDFMSSGAEVFVGFSTYLACQIGHTALPHIQITIY